MNNIKETGNGHFWNKYRHPEKYTGKKARNEYGLKRNTT